MTKFFLATSNIKHDGELFTKGSIVAGEIGTFGTLINDGLLQEIEGASSFEEAQEILNKKVDETDTEADIEVAPKDTWGPSPEPTETPTDTTAPEIYDGPMVLVRFLSEYELVDENNQKTGEILKPGDETEIPEPTVQPLVDDKIVEVIKEDDKPTDTEDKTESKGILGGIFGKKKETKVEAPLDADNL